MVGMSFNTHRKMRQNNYFKNLPIAFKKHIKMVIQTKSIYSEPQIYISYLKQPPITDTYLPK